MKESSPSFTANTSELSQPKDQGPIVFKMDQPVETPAEAPSPISTEIQPEVGEVSPAAAETSKETPKEEQVVDLDQEAPKAETTLTRTVESGPILAKGYERIGKFGEKVRGAKNKLVSFGGMLLRGAGKILKGTLKLAKGGLAALASPDVLIQRGAKSVAEFGAGVKNLAVNKTTESYMYARDSFLEAWGGLKEKGNNVVEGATNKVTGLWKGMIAMKTEILLQSLEKKRQQAATQETTARTTKEAFEAQIAVKMKLLEDLRRLPKTEDSNNKQELALAA